MSFAYHSFIHDVDERGEIIVVRICTVNVAVDCYKPDPLLGEEHFSVETYFQIISPQTAHVLHDQGADPVFFNICQQRLKPRALKVCYGVTVIRIMTNIAVTIALCIILEILLLVQDAVAFTLKFIISGQSFI